MSQQAWISIFIALPPTEKRAAWINLTDEQKWQLQERYEEQRKEEEEKAKKEKEKKEPSKWLVHDGMLLLLIGCYLPDDR